MSARVAARLLVLSVVTFQYQHAVTARAVQEPIPLELGTPIDRELGTGQSQTYRVDIGRGQHASMTVEQRGIDVAVEVLGPANDSIAVFDNEIRILGREEIAFVAETGGAYTLVVRARFKNIPDGRYELRLTETRAATDADRALHESRRLQAEYLRLHREGRFDDQLPPIERALAIADEVLGGEHPYVAHLATDLGNAYLATMENAKARPLYERALSILERTLGPEHPQTAYVTNRLAYALRETSATSPGEVVRMEKAFERALEVSEKTLGLDHPQVALCLHTLGQLYESRGDSVRAEQLYRRALTIVETALGTDQELFADLLNAMGTLNLSRRDYERAEQYLQRAARFWEGLPEHLALAVVLNNLGIVAREKKDYPAAEAYYLRSLSIRERINGPDHPDISVTRFNLANLYRAQGDYAKSLDMHLRSLASLEKTAGPNQWITVVSLGNIARTYAAMGDLPNATAIQARVDAAIEPGIVMNLAIGSERQKLAFLSTVAERTDRTVSLERQLRPGDPDASRLAVLVLLQRKGRVLDAMIDTFAAVRRHARPPDRALLDRLNETTAQLARLVLNGPQKTPPAEYRKTVKELEEGKERLEAEISRQSAEFRARSRPVTLEAVQAAIPPAAALLEFAVYRPFDPIAASNDEAYGAARYAAYVVRRQGVPQGADLGEAKVIDDAVGSLRQALGDPSKPKVRELARALDEKIMQPLRPLLRGATQLLVSPDGGLNLIPLEALVDEQGRYLIERYSFAYLSSGRDLLRMQGGSRAESKPAVIADPSFGEPASAGTAGSATAPKPTAASDRRRSITVARDLSEMYFAPLGGTAQEARAILTVFPEAELLTGARATETALKALEAPRLLHVATHGFFLQDAAGAAAGPTQGNPLLRSGLALADANRRGGSADDGILTALEASGLNLWGTKLVVLSACDTGLGVVRNGDGVYGLRRAFVLAGAESLVMSLWPVSDYSTRRMMESYYRNLKQGLGRGAALRQVQLDMLARNRRLHPFYWANFIQSGEWGALGPS